MYEEMKCLGLESLIADEGSRYALMESIRKQGRAVRGYSGGPTYNLALGFPEFMASFKPGSRRLTGIDAHCAGLTVWDVRLHKDITPFDWPSAKRRLVCELPGMVHPLVVKALNADVLPSYVRGDSLRLQLVAFPLSIEVFKDWAAYAAAVGEEGLKRGGIYQPGGLLPIGLLDSLAAKQGKPVPEGARDQEELMLLAGEIKALYHGRFRMGDEELSPYIEGVLATRHGDVQVAFTLEQVPGDMRPLLGPGAVLSCNCLLSGDAAILEYEQGYVMDMKHHLALLRHTFLRGQAGRLLSVLAEDADYVSLASGKACRGAQDVVDRLDLVARNSSGKYFVDFATLVDPILPQGHGVGPYPAGTPCLLTAMNAKGNYTSIALLRLNGEGAIQRIDVLPFSCNRVMLGSGNIVPKTPSDAILIKAKSHGMLGSAAREEAFLKSTETSPAHWQAAEFLADVAVRQGLHLNGQTITRLLVYAFGHAMLRALAVEECGSGDFLEALPPFLLGGAAIPPPPGLDERGRNLFTSGLRLAEDFHLDFGRRPFGPEARDPSGLEALRDTLLTLLRLGSHAAPILAPAGQS